MKSIIIIFLTALTIHLILDLRIEKQKVKDLEADVIVAVDNLVYQLTMCKQLLK